jgi:3-keto-disaccharide hydrolase
MAPVLAFKNIIIQFKMVIMLSSTFSRPGGAIMGLWLLFSPCFLFAQNTHFENYDLKPVQVNMSVTTIDGKKAVRVSRDTAVKGADIPTFVRLGNTDNFSNGTIEVMLLSRLLPNADASYARGFIGLAFRINKDNTQFESIYIRPTNGRADDQLRRNHSTQYFSYPDYKFDRLRKEAEGKYESYADMALNEWIKMKIVVKDAQAKLYLNDNPQPVLIVNDLKLGAANSGAVGLWLDTGTDAFFRNIKVIKN